MGPSRAELSKDFDVEETMEGAGMVEQFEPRDIMLQLRELGEQDKIRESVKYDSRESLAWDNAFLTSEGVLEPEELCSMINMDLQNTRGVFEQRKQVLEPVESSDLPDFGKCGRFNLRNSLAWDNAFFTSAGILEPEELASIIYKEVQNRKIVEHSEQELRSLESHGLDEIGGNGRYILRQSLAWDNAFFTSAGVLEPEELSCINKGVAKDWIALLPQIEEVVHRSTESISTIGDDSLESLEADLFEDLRASVQRSNEVQNTVNSDEKLGSEVTKCQYNHGGKMDAISGRKINPSTVSRMGTNRTRIFGKSTRQSAVTSGGSLSSLSKVPKIVGRIGSTSTPPTKRTLLSADNIKKEKDSSKKVVFSSSSRIANIGAPVLKRSASGGSCGSLHGHATSRKKYSRLSSLSKIEPESPSSSSDSLNSTLSDKIGDSDLKPLKRKVGPRATNSPSSALIFKTPSRIITKNKVQSVNLRRSTNLKSVKNLSPGLAHATSNSECSSESSSSNLAVNRRSTCLRSLYCKKSSTGQNNVDGHYFAENVSQLGLLVPPVETTSAETQMPAAVKSSNFRGQSTKSSSTGVKSRHIKDGKDQSHSAISGVSSKVESVIPSPSTSMSKLGQSQSAKSSSSVTSKKPGLQLDAIDGECKPPPVEELSKSTMKLSRLFKSVHSSSSKVQEKSSPGTSKQSQLMAKEVGGDRLNMEKHNPELCSDRNAGALDCLSNRMNLDMNSSSRSNINGGLGTSMEITIPTLKNFSCLLDNIDKKAHIEDRINSLCGEILGININEAVGDKFSFSR